MALLKPRNKNRWLHPYEVAYLLGLVQTKPGDSPETIKKAEKTAMETLRHCAESWGIVKVKRCDKMKATVAYTEESLLAYMESREQKAQG